MRRSKEANYHPNVGMFCQMRMRIEKEEQQGKESHTTTT